MTLAVKRDIKQKQKISLNQENIKIETKFEYHCADFVIAWVDLRVSSLYRMS